MVNEQFKNYSIKYQFQNKTKMFRKVIRTSIVYGENKTLIKMTHLIKEVGDAII